MTIVVHVDPQPDFALKPKIPSKLTIKKKQNPGPSDAKYEYEFKVKEFVVTDLANPDLIALELDLTQLPTNVVKMYIHDFCCSRGNSMEPSVYKNAQGLPTSSFGVNTVHVGLRPSLLPRELVSVGLLIAIVEKDPQTGTTTTELILCDPQVGNGPPLPPGQGGGAKMLPAISLTTM